MHQSVLAWLETRKTGDFNIDTTDPYSTDRNSSLTATKWRDDVTFEEVESIQNQCHAVMEEAGYNVVSQESQLTDRSFRLIGSPRYLSEQYSN